MYLRHYAFKLQHSKAQDSAAVVAKANKKRKENDTKRLLELRLCRSQKLSNAVLSATVSKNHHQAANNC